jgi:hypothetical protein
MSESPRGGGGDTRSGDDSQSTNKFYGDSQEMHGNARGGNDMLTRGPRSTNNIPKTQCVPPWWLAQ